MEEKNSAIEEIEKEIEETRRKAKSDDFEIEIAEEKEAKTEAKAEDVSEDSSEEVQEVSETKEEKDRKYSEAVQSRLNKLSAQRRQAEAEARKYQEEVAQLKARLDRMENSNVEQQNARAQSEFENR